MIRRVFIFCTVFYMGVVGASPLYTSSVIAINETGISASDAKQKGFDTAIAQFWNKVIKQILLNPGDAEQVSPAEQKAFIKKIDVLSEKTHSNRYSADIIIYFDPLRIQENLREKNIPFVEDKGFPALIIPVFTYKGVLQIYEYTNMWQTALQNINASGGLLPLYVSDRGVKDSLLVDRHALYNRDTLLTMGKVFDADTVFVASVVVDNRGVALNYTAIGGILDGKSFTLRQDFLRFMAYNDPRMDRVVLETLSDLAVAFFTDAELQWKKQHSLAEKDGKKLITAVFDIQTFADWQQVKQTLLAYKMVRDVELYSVQGNIVTASINYIGVLKNFYLFLQKKKYDIKKVDSIWIVNHSNAEI